MEGTHFSLTSLLIVTVLSFLVPLFVKRIKKIYIPVVVGEILVGMIIGKSGFDIIEMDSSLEFIQFFGLAYLMFVAGLEIDFSIFAKGSHLADKNKSKSGLSFVKNPLILSIIILLITLTLSYTTALFLEHFGFISDPLLMALIMGTTSLGIVIPVLKEKRISSTSYGQYIITAAVIADFVTMLLISVAVSLFKGGLSPELLLIFGLLFLVFVFYRIGSKFQSIKIFKELSHGTTQIGIRGAFAIMLLFLVLSESIGVEMILGSFLAGTVISLVSKNQSGNISEKLDAIGFGFLIPTFFILVGVNFDIGVLINNKSALALVPLLFILFYLIKGVPALLLRLVFNWKESIAGGVLLTAQLSLTIAAAAIGLEIGAISEEVSAALILVAILTSLTSPMIFGKLIPARKEDEDQKHVIIIGTTKNAILLGKRLTETGIMTIYIDTKKEKVEDINMENTQIIYGDATDNTLLESADIYDANSVIVATGNDSINFEIGENIAHNYKRQVVVLLNDPTYIDKANNNDLIRVVNPQLSTVNLLENLVRHPVAASLFEDRADMHLEEVEVKNPELLGKSLRYIKLPGEVLIFAVYRNGETIIPHGDTTFNKGDILLAMGPHDEVQEFIDYALNL